MFAVPEHDIIEASEAAEYLRMDVVAFQAAVDKGCIPIHSDNNGTPKFDRGELFAMQGNSFNRNCPDPMANWNGLP